MTKIVESPSSGAAEGDRREPVLLAERRATGAVAAMRIAVGGCIHVTGRSKRLSISVAPQPVSGRGRVYTFTINRYRWVPGFEPPYIVASIEFDEQPGLRFMSNVIDCGFDEIRCDLEVEVVFAKHGEVYIPLFRPVASS
jgi:hypothetical protein